MVDADHCGRGIGRMLLDATLAALEAEGAPRVLLPTAENYESGQRPFVRAPIWRTTIKTTRARADDCR